MKIAFLISAYTDPHQLGNMIKALESQNHWFFIHVDKKVEITPFRESVKDYKQVAFVTNRFRSNWGGYGQVRYQNELLRCAIESNITFDRIFLLTAQDYPLISNEQISTILRENPQKEYINGYCITNDASQKENVTVYHFFRDAPEWLHLRKIAYDIMHVLPIRKKPYLVIESKKWLIYKSSSYMCITWDLAKYIYEQINKNKQIERYFKHSYVPEELVIATIVFNSPYRNYTTNLSTGGYPGLNVLSPITFFHYDSKIQVFEEKDYDELLSSKRMFARKFSSTQSKKLMDLLAQRSNCEAKQS